MTRSTIQPESLKLWRTIAAADGLSLDLSACWNDKQITVSVIGLEDQQLWEYDTIRFSVPYRGDPSRVADYLTIAKPSLLLFAKTLWEHEHGTPALNTEERAQLIDRETDAAITAAVNPSGYGEQISILRAQLVRVLAGDLNPTEDFSRLNDISTAEIVKAQTLKDAL